MSSEKSNLHSNLLQQSEITKKLYTFFTSQRLNKSMVEFFLFAVVFLFNAYFSVSTLLPNAVPIHHDDYTNYASGSGNITLGWVRPLSTLAIQVLSGISPDTLIWVVRLLTVLYIFLHWKLFLEVYGAVQFRLLFSILYASAVLASPIVVEYGRYTGMVTHLISGCLGVAASLLMIRQIKFPNLINLSLSVCLFILSALAKEDFVLLYAASVGYTLLCAKHNKARISLAGMVGIGGGALVVLSAKVLVKSGFLGVPDPNSTYYIDISLRSVALTIIKYLKGALHPAMLEHGKFYFLLFVFSAASFMFVALVRRRIPSGSFCLIAGLAVMAPYSVLPNHINAYYELLWAPLFISGAVLAGLDLFAVVLKNKLERHLMALLLMFSITVVANLIDYQGRKSIATWYDSVSLSNSLTLTALQENRENINKVGEACITGADIFSPWYMHDGSYLVNVLGLNAHWIIFIGDNRFLEQGISVSRGKSAVRVSVVPSTDSFPERCQLIDLEKRKKA